MKHSSQLTECSMCISPLVYEQLLEANDVDRRAKTGKRLEKLDDGQQLKLRVRIRLKKKKWLLHPGS